MHRLAANKLAESLALKRLKKPKLTKAELHAIAGLHDLSTRKVRFGSRYARAKQGIYNKSQRIKQMIRNNPKRSAALAAALLGGGLIAREGVRRSYNERAKGSLGSRRERMRNITGHTGKTLYDVGVGTGRVVLTLADIADEVQNGEEYNRHQNARERRAHPRGVLRHFY